MVLGTRFASKLLHQQLLEIDTVTGNEQAKYNSDRQQCSCHQYHSSELPCRHILFCRRQAGLALFDETLYPVYYLEKFVTDGGQQQSNDDVHDPIADMQHFQHQFDNFTMYPAKTSNAKIKKNETTQQQQYIKMKNLALVWAEVTAHWGQEKFDHYLRHLNILIDLGRSGSWIRDPELDFSREAAESQGEKERSQSTGDDLTTSSKPTSSSTDNSFDEGHAFLYSPVSFSANKKEGIAIVENNEMLTDDIVNSVSALCMKSFPNFRTQPSGLSQAKFQQVSFSDQETYVQIHQLPSKTHFVLSHLYSREEVHVYDSMVSCYKNYAVNKDFASQLQQLYPSISKFMYIPGPQQSNGVDCGLFCLATLLNILFKREISSNLEFCSLREHLVSILTDELIVLFPQKKVSRGAKRKQQPISIVNECPVNDLQSLNFHEVCSSKGAPKGKRLRFNKKE